MKVHSYLPDPIKKRCERCDLFFLIPAIRESHAREIALQFFPCTHCAYVRDINRPLYNRTGHCVGCLLPFAFIPHHGKGKCMRCYQATIRDESRAA